MKFTASKKNALPILKEVNKAVDSKSTTHILRNILFVAEEDVVKVVGYNNLISIEGSFKAEVKEKGKLAILGDIFISAIELSNGDDFTLTLKAGESRADIKTGKGQYKVAVMSAEDFPDLPSINKEGSIEITTTTGNIGRLIEKTIFASDVKDERVFVQGVNVKTDGNKICFSGVNSQLMARTFIEEKNFDYGNFAVTIHKSVFEDLKGILPSADVPMVVKIDNKRIMFEFIDTRMIGRLLDINYPDKTIDKKIKECSDFESYISINSAELLGAVKCILNISSKDLRRGDIVLQTMGNTMMVKSETDMASGEETIEMIEKVGKDFKCLINGLHLSKCLSSLDSESVKIKHGEKLLGLTGNSTEKDKGVFYLILPIEYNNI